MAKSSKGIVFAKMYNSTPNVFFMMKSDDDRWDTPEYRVIANPSECKYDHRNRTITAKGVTYRVFSDWSLKQI